MEIPLISIDYLRGYESAIEDTLLFHLWLKKNKYLKSDFIVSENMIDSRAINRAKHYLENFKDKIIRGGNNLKHQNSIKCCMHVTILKNMDVQ